MTKRIYYKDKNCTITNREIEEYKKEIKPRGWANLQEQLKEIREESFKQGIWKGRAEALADVEKIIFNKICDYEKIKKQGDKILNDGRKRDKESKARLIKTNSHITTKINLLKELQEEMKAK